MKTVFRLMALLAALLPSGHAEEVALLARVSDWKTQSPFKEPTLEFSTVDANGSPRLVVKSRDSSRGVGGWVCALPTLEQGRRYRFEVACSTQGMEAPRRQLWAIITVGGREFQELEVVRSAGQRHELALEFTPVKKVSAAQLHLYVAEARGGTVTWESARMRDITASYKPRVAHIGAISGKPRSPKTPQEAIDFYVAKLDQARGLGLDLICLPENVNVDEVPGDRWAWLETIPGPTTERLSAKARELKVYIAASIAEREGTARYNTAVLIDRQGQIVAKYHKAQLTVGERLLSGITPGGDFVVHEADFGRVGLMVCYDHHFPEIARILAVKGAEVIALPNAADAREGGSLWESAMRIRAVDNHVFIASAVNFGRSLVVGPDGKIMAMSPPFKEAPGALVHAKCELGDSVANYTGQPINRRYLQQRRPEIYRLLTADDGSIEGNE